MSKAPSRLSAGQPVVEDNGTMSQAFRLWAVQVSDQMLSVNTGSPEGVLEAPQYALYIDEAAPLTPVQYRKMLPHIGGDRSMGWVVI